MVFYSRYFIHEMMLMVFTFGFLWCGWRHASTRRRGWAVGTGICLGLMQATKETYVFCLAAAAAAFLASWGWSRLRCEPVNTRRVLGRDVAWGAGAFLLISVILFTSFFQNWQGPLDAWKTYGPWLARAEGQSPHVHPWSYYWGLLLFTRRGSGPIWSEALILGLGLAGLIAGLGRRRPGGVEAGWVRIVAFYTLTLSLVYTVIPYKTPWCVLGFWHGWILLAGAGAATLLGTLRWGTLRWGVGVLLATGMLQLGWQAHRAAYLYPDSQRNPYVYAHTLSSLLDLVDQVKAVADSAATGRNTTIKVMAQGEDYWPLPWYLREFPSTGWYPGVPSEAKEAAAPIIIASPEFEPALRSALGENQRALGLFGLRPGIFLQLHVESTLWEQYLARSNMPP
jgi:uncharacterized protein (TIGR03663 family)